jgi:flagellar basal body-associated protein FliL
MSKEFFIGDLWFKTMITAGLAIFICGLVGYVTQNTNKKNVNVENSKPLVDLETYDQLALTLVSKKVVGLKKDRISSEEDRKKLLEELGSLKNNWASTIKDEILKDRTIHWLSVHEASTRNYIIGKGNPYEIERQEKQDKEKRLAKTLGVDLESK